MRAVAGQICHTAGLSEQEGLEFPHCLFPQGSPVMSFAEQLTRLQVFLDADELHEEALDYVAAHGYLTALSICAEDVPEREWIDALFAEEPHYSSDAQREEIKRLRASFTGRTEWPTWLLLIGVNSAWPAL